VVDVSSMVDRPESARPGPQPRQVVGFCQPPSDFLGIPHVQLHDRADRRARSAPALRSTVRRLTSGEFARAGFVTYVFAAGGLLANLVTGVMTARLLGPEGRGIVVALASGVQLCGFVFAAGVAQSLAYFAVREPPLAARLLGGWAIALAPFALLGVACAELLLPLIFAGEPSAVAIGRWFALAVVLIVALELSYGVLLARNDYLGFNLVRLGQPTLTALGYVLLWSLGAFTVAGALASLAVATAIVAAFGIARGGRRLGIARPDLGLVRRSLWFGVRAQGSTVAASVNARLDVAVLPAFASAGAVGLYSVATNVSLIVYQLASTFAAIVLPVTASDTAERSRRKVLIGTLGTIAVCGALGAVLAIAGEPLLGLVYGAQFRAAIDPLRLLVPGAVLFAAASVVASGLAGAGRPFTATFGYGVGAIVMVGGLALFVPAGGTTAAAIVSSVSYAVVFLALLGAYRRVAQAAVGGGVSPLEPAAESASARTRTPAHGRPR